MANLNFNEEGPVSNSVDSLRPAWPWFLGLGIFLILLGLVAIGSSVATTLITVTFLGFILLAAGIAKLIYSFWSKEWSGFFLSLLVGLLYLVIGSLFLFKTVLSAAALTLLIGSLFVVSGLFKIITSIIYRFDQREWIFISGVISLLLGILVLSEWPSSSLWLIGLFVGIDLLFYGIFGVYLSYRLREHRINRK